MTSIKVGVGIRVSISDGVAVGTGKSPVLAIE